MPQAINNTPLDTYHRWMEVVVCASLAGLPTVNVPAGFNPQGLPMGLQLMGKPQADLSVLQLAAAFETTISDLLARQPSLS
jgi:amidase